MKILYGIIDKDKHKTPCLTEDNNITLYMDNKLIKLLSTKDEVATLLSTDDIVSTLLSTDDKDETLSSTDDKVSVDE